MLQKIKEIYKTAPQKFSAPDAVAKKVIEEMPFPRTRYGLSSGVGRLKLFQDANSELFGDLTTHTAPPPDATLGEELTGKDPALIQERVLAEAVAKDTALRGTLNPKVTPDRDDQVMAVAEALGKRKAAQTRRFSLKANRDMADFMARQMRAVAIMDRFSALAFQSGVQGFGLGPLEKGVHKVTGTTPLSTFIRGREAGDAAKEVLETLPLVKEFLSREFLESLGEERKSNVDVSGMQKVLPGLNTAEKFEAGKFRQLRKYVINNLKHQFQFLGEYEAPDSLMALAAGIGIDVKNLKPKHNYYNKYVGGNYRVTGQQMPAYSDATIKNLRDAQILSQVSTSLAGVGTGYKLLTLDSTGRPQVVGPPTNRVYATTVLTPDQLKDPQYKKMIDFNVKRLLLLQQR